MAIFHLFKLFYDFVIANASKYLFLGVAYHHGFIQSSPILLRKSVFMIDIGVLMLL